MEYIKVKCFWSSKVITQRGEKLATLSCLCLLMGIVCRKQLTQCINRRDNIKQMNRSK